MALSVLTVMIFLEDAMRRLVYIVFAWIIVSPYYAYAAKAGVYFAPKLLASVQHTKGTVGLSSSSWGPRHVFGANAGGAFAVGYDFQSQFDVPIRMELEYSASDHLSHTGSTTVFRKRIPFRAKVGVQTLLVNTCFDILNKYGFIPYITAGAGAAFITTKGSCMGTSTCRTEAVPAGQVGLGCSHAFTEHVSLDIGYRFVFMGGTDTSCDTVTLKLRQNYMHQAIFGLRMTF